MWKRGARKKPTLGQIRNIKAKTVQKYLQQFDQLVSWLGVLHRTYEQYRAKYHQLILPMEFSAQAMENASWPTLSSSDWAYNNFSIRMCFLEHYLTGCKKLG